MKIIFIPALFLAVLSCKKDTCVPIHEENFSYDTIHPHAYYPAYPGSYWVYNDSVTVSVEPEWQSFVMKEYYENDGCPVLITDVVLLPKIEEKHLHYDRFIESYSDHYNSEDLLFNSVSTWQSYENPESKYSTEAHPAPNSTVYCRHRELLPAPTTLEVNGVTYSDLLKIEEKWYATGGGAGNHLEYQSTVYFYAKDVGPVRIIDTLQTLNGPVGTQLDLSSCFIQF